MFIFNNKSGVKEITKNEFYDMIRSGELKLSHTSLTRGYVKVKDLICTPYRVHLRAK
jgi:hypothetical protein